MSSQPEPAGDMVKHSALIFFALMAGTAAHAQDATSPGAQDPAVVTGDILAQLIRKARKNKLLQHRLFTRRHYKGEERGNVFLVEGSGRARLDGIELMLEFEILGNNRGEKGSLLYTFGNDGRLRSLLLREERRKGWKGIEIEITNGMARAQRVRNGKPSGSLKEAPWTGENLSLFSVIVLLPALADQGLPPKFTCSSVGEDDDIGKKGRRPKQFTVTREAKPRKTKAGLVQVVKIGMEGKRRSLAEVFLGTGKDTGVIRQVAFDPKPDGSSDMTLVLVSPKQIEALRKLAPLIKNEARAVRALQTIQWAQQSFKRKQSGYAESLEELKQGRHLRDKDVAEGAVMGYLLMVRRSPDAAAWIALAVPDEQGKTGRYYFVTTQDGKIHRTTKPVELNEDCTLPPGLELVR